MYVKLFLGFGIPIGIYTGFSEEITGFYKGITGISAGILDALIGCVFFIGSPLFFIFGPFLSAVNMYVKLFLGFGIPIGIYTGFSGGILAGLIACVSIGSLASLIVGAFLSMVFGELGNKMESKQSETVTVDTPFEFIFEKCLQAMKNIKAKVITTDKETGTITGKTKMSWTSVGEDIQISAVRSEDGKAKVTVSSAPNTWKTTLREIEKGRQNITSLIDYINS